MRLVRLGGTGHVCGGAQGDCRCPVLDVTQSALFVARDRGYFQKEGLEVDLILMRGGVANQALIAGNVEFTTVPTAGLQAALQGAPFKVVLSTFHKPMFWLYSRPRSAAQGIA